MTLELSPADKQRLVTRSTLGLLALFMVGTVLSLIAGATTVPLQNIITMLIISTPLLLRGRLQSNVHICILLFVATIQIATDSYTEQQGAMLMLITERASRRLGFLKTRQKLRLFLIISLLLLSSSISAWDYLYVPLVQDSTSLSLRIYRIIARTSLLATAVWLWEVVEWGPNRKMRKHTANLIVEMQRNQEIHTELNARDQQLAAKLSDLLPRSKQ